MTRDLPYLFIAFLSFVSFVRKAHHLRRPNRSESLPALCAALGALTLATLLFAPSCRHFLDQTFHLPGFARWLANSFGIMTSCSLQIMAMRFISGAQATVRLRKAVAVSTVVAMGALLLPQRLADAPDFVTRYSTNPSVAAYFMLDTAFVLVVASDLARLTFQYSGHTQMGYLRLGMRLVGWGAILALGYAVYREATVISRLAGTSLWGDEHLITQILAVPGGALTVIGASLATWGPRMAAPMRRIRQRRALYRLHPLWVTLTETIPDVVLDRANDFSNEPSARLHRYLVEINDALMILAPYRRRDTVAESFGVAERKHSRSIERALADQEAKLLIAALRAYRSGATAENETGTPAMPARSADEEVRWFGLVADALTLRLRDREAAHPIGELDNQASDRTP